MQNNNKKKGKYSEREEERSRSGRFPQKQKVKRTTKIANRKALITLFFVTKIIRKTISEAGRLGYLFTR